MRRSLFVISAIFVVVLAVALWKVFVAGSGGVKTGQDDIVLLLERQAKTFSEDATREVKQLADLARSAKSPVVGIGAGFSASESLHQFLVKQVEMEKPAAVAGLEKGDVVLWVKGGDLLKLLRGMSEPGTVFIFKVFRDGKEKEIRVVAQEVRRGAGERAEILVKAIETEGPKRIADMTQAVEKLVSLVKEKKLTEKDVEKLPEYAKANKELAGLWQWYSDQEQAVQKLFTEK